MTPCFICNPLPQHQNRTTFNNLPTKSRRSYLGVYASASPRRAIVVGAGVAGLQASKLLADAGISVTILEGSDAVGGRIRSDVVDGFILDRGFQVFIEAYPQCKKRYDMLAVQAHRSPFSLLNIFYSFLTSFCHMSPFQSRLFLTKTFSIPSRCFNPSFKCILYTF